MYASISRRYSIVLLLTFILLSGISESAFAGGNVAYYKHWIHGVPVHVVTVNMNSQDVKVSPAIARYGIGTSEGFGSMLSRLKPKAAITGTYFCVKRLIPVGDLVVDSNLVISGSVGTWVCFTPDNRVEFISKTKDVKALLDWATYPYAIRTGPRLVNNGVAYVSSYTEGFRDGAIYRPARRSALGVTRSNKLLLVSVNRPIYLGKLAKIMKGLGAVDAVNLDGGTSTALSCGGRVLSHPGRRLTNLLVVYDSPARFAKIKSSLAPHPVFAGTTPNVN